MIYAFIGTDGQKVRTKANAWIEAGRAKDSQLTYVRITEDLFNEDLVLENLGGQSLFAKRMLISLDGVMQKNEAFILEHLQHLAESDNVFALIEGKLLAKAKKEIEKHAVKVFSYDLPAKDSKPNFAIWNAIDRGDGLVAWKEFQKEHMEGKEVETLAGFIHSKLRRNIPKDKHAARQSREFIDFYHKARRGEIDFKEGLELFLLKSI
ncbi:hypothetical protein COB87_000940 [Candidatus Wolfebacteria bacterium]|nr:hypothetical protein [Candidatus Wolfebacteria bacterium]